MPPSAIYQTYMPSPLGDVLLAATNRGLTGVWFAQGQMHMPARTQWRTDDAHPTLLAAAQQLKAYFEGQRHSFDVPLYPMWGTVFQRAVWQALQHTAYGQTTTYANIALRIGNPKAVRAVGAAIGKNPHSILVPCHRVLGANGSLTGFAGGLERKRHLLLLEAKHA